MDDRVVLKKNNDELLSDLGECLETGARVRITVVGNSMFPLLKSGRDSVLLRKYVVGEPLKKRIVLFRRANEKYVLHRVVKVHGDCVDIRGDAQKALEYDVKTSQIIAVVTELSRKKKTYKALCAAERLYLFFWNITIPLRGRLVKCLMK